MNEAALLENYLTVGALLFGIGLVGFLSRRNMIVMFLAAEMMLQGVSISLVAWSRFHQNWSGQVFVVFIITVAAAEAAIALALVLALFRQTGTLDIAVWTRLRESNLTAYVDRELPERPDEPEPVWPKLTPAGVEPKHDEPKHDEREALHRSHV